MSITFTVTSSDDYNYEVELDDSAIADDPAEYPVSIKAIIAEDPSAFIFTKLINKDFIVNLTYEPDVTWSMQSDEMHDEMMTAIGKAYLAEIGY